MCFSVWFFFLFTSAEEYNLFIPLPYRQDEEKNAVFYFFIVTFLMDLEID